VVGGKERYEVWKKIGVSNWSMLKCNMVEYQEAVDFLLLMEMKDEEKAKAKA
jgi:hypothetical protein